MALRNLRTRFLLSSGLLVLMTVASGAWGVFALTRLGEAVDATLDESEETIVLAASLATAIDREDDALLLRLALAQAQGPTHSCGLRPERQTAAKAGSPRSGSGSRKPSRGWHRSSRNPRSA